MAADDFGSRPDLLIRVDRPLTWWRATPEQISERLKDPDQGHIPRWASYDQDWKAIGSTVSAVADAIAAGRYSVNPEQSDEGIVQVPDPGLGVKEKQIVDAWFLSAPVTSDPWIDGWSDGRHRTWQTSRADPAVALPVRGSSIGYVNSYDIPRLGADWEKLYQHDLERLTALEWFDQSDPLNAQFIRSHEIASAGMIPPRIPDTGPKGQINLSPELEAMRTSMYASFPQPAVMQQPPSAGSHQAEPTQAKSHQTNLRQDKGFGR